MIIQKTKELACVWRQKYKGGGEKGKGWREESEERDKGRKEKKKEEEKGGERNRRCRGEGNMRVRDKVNAVKC